MFTETISANEIRETNPLLPNSDRYETLNEHNSGDQPKIPE